MEELLGLLIFIAISIVGFISKAYEERKARQQQAAPRETAPEVVPGETHRPPQGDAGSRPRTAAPRMPVPDMPRSPSPPIARPVLETPPRPAQETIRPLEAPPKPMAAPRPTRSRPPREEVERERLERLERKRVLEETRRQARAALEQATELRRRSVPAAEPEGELVPVVTLAHDAAAQGDQPPRPLPLERMLRSMFVDGDAIRRGVLMREILGPPKGLEG